ncbi:MAG TPA: hypothetical protein DEQ61_15065, partial [Streptomyces sp.]|nr:hypothetical protein [Streptomyces sp.]
ALLGAARLALEAVA